MITFQNEFWPPNITNRNNLDGKFCAETKKKNLNEISKTKCLNVLLGLAVCLSVPTQIENNLLVWMLGFISVLVWGGRDVDWCLDLCYLVGRGGGGILFYKFWGWGCIFKRPARDACLYMGELQAPPAPHFVFLITL